MKTKTHLITFAAAIGVVIPSICLAQRGPVPGFDSSTPYLIHYGNWTPALVTAARNDYKMVILHPSSNITPTDIATIRSGPDQIAGTADDVKVLGYISVGEDDRPDAPFVGDGNGPRVDPRASYSSPLDEILDPLGNPSPGGTGYASYYLDDQDADGLPDQNSTFGGYYVNPGDPAWYEILKSKTKAVDGRAGIQELLTTTHGAGYGCDGLFLDTLDTPAPNSFGATLYEWTAEAYQTLVKSISDDNPSKLLLANRGVFFYNPNLKTYAYTLRPYINLLMFESYYTDSSGSGAASAYFDDNKFNYAPKLNAEANRPDGFTVIGLGYTTAGESAALIAQDFIENQRDQGWMLYRTNPALDATPFNTQSAAWNAANPDVSAPIWNSTAATIADSDPETPGNQPPTPRIGIQQVAPISGGAVVRWDIANDQTGPVKYNLYYTTDSAMNFTTATKIPNISPAIPQNYASGTGAGRFPYEYALTGLADETPYLFAIRAEDALGNEDTNTVALPLIPETGSPTSSHYANISVDGDMSDWAEVPQALTDPVGDGIPDIVSMKVANDENYLYVLVEYSEPFDVNTLNGSPSTFLSIDNDANPATGFDVYGLGQIGAEISFQNDFPFAQDIGDYNIGATFEGSVGIAPYNTNTRLQEYRIPRDMSYTVGAGPARAVFPGSEVILAMWTDDAVSAEFAGPIKYEFAATPPIPAESNYGTIEVDGDLADWANIPTTYTHGPDTGNPDIVSVKVANDDNFLYVLVEYNGEVKTNNLDGAPSTFLSIDNDADVTTGFDVYGLGQVGAEVSFQNDIPFAQDNGAFNIGQSFSPGAVAIAPYAAETSFQEYRIDRNATYNLGGADLPVFPQDLIRLAFWSDDATTAEFAGGFYYRFAESTAGSSYQTWKSQNFSPEDLLNPAISGDGADPDHDGLSNLMEFALGGDPNNSDPQLQPMSAVTELSGSKNLEFTYLRRTTESGLAYLPETSSDLQSWNDDPAQFTTLSTTPADPGFEEVKIRLTAPIGTDPTFIRLKVSLNQ